MRYRGNKMWLHERTIEWMDERVNGTAWKNNVFTKNLKDFND